MRRGELFWGALLVIVGGLLLLDRFLGFGFWRALGPLLLISLGLWLVWASTRKREPLEVEEVTLPLDDTERVQLRLRHGLGELVLGAGEDPNALLSGRFVGGVTHRERRSQETLRVTLEPKQQLFSSGFHSLCLGPRPDKGLNWELRLNRAVAVYIEAEGGLSSSRYDLSALDVKSFHLRGGLASTELTLPARAVHTQVRIESGMGSVGIRVPEGVAARIHTRGGLATSDIDTRRFPQVGDGYLSPGYDAAEHRVDIEVEHGLGSVSIR
ncbi:MAG: hypothetical protein JXA74_02005 [Anaerolineae bacterium]|nr:hypothetical protein [Anaerolineae bacterium]